MLRGYEQRIRRLLEAAAANYEEVRLYVFSDHGMANCDTLIDLKPANRATAVATGQGLRRCLRLHDGPFLVLQRPRAPRGFAELA